MKTRIFPIILLLVAILFTACAPVEITEAPQEAEQTVPTKTVKIEPTQEIPLDTPAVDPVETATPVPVQPETSQEIPDVAVLAIEELARNLSISAADVQFISIEEMQWPDGCLGAARPDEVCTQAIVDGYRIILEANGQQYELRTDYQGEVMRQVQAANFNPKGDLVKSPALQNARQFVADETGIDIIDVKLVSMKAVEWLNSCLEVVRADMACMQVITPGYQIVFEVNGEMVEVRTDQTGITVFLVEPSETNSSGGLDWEMVVDGECHKLVIQGATARTGPCLGTLSEQNLPDIRVQEWDELITSFDAFDASIGDANVIFDGQGKQFADEYERRSISEWSRIVYAELDSQALLEQPDEVVTWHREGGFAGFCDDVTLSAGGWAYVSSCRVNASEDPIRVRLNAEQIEKIFAWYDGYKSFETAQKDPAAADAMLVELVFSGDGKKEATGEVEQDISILVENLVRQAAEQ